MTSIEQSLAVIVTVLREHSGIDFEAFRRSTLESSVATRASLLGLSADAYSHRVQIDPREDGTLLEACLVGHTSFFRDHDVMVALADRVFPAVARSVPGVVRAWVVGTASGEEAWSLAILLDAVAPRRFDMLATDVATSALARAMRAEYPLQMLPPGFAEGSFEFDVNVMRVRKELRDLVHFAEHDIVGPRLLPASAVIANFDVVSCRNVLMWFDERFRRLALDCFAAVMRPGSVLVLGRSESMPPNNTAFAPLAGVDPGLRIFERIS